jgi:hypothetical protein
MIIGTGSGTWETIEAEEVVKFIGKIRSLK